VPGTIPQPVSELLAQWRAGDEESLRRLVPLVYNELRRLAHCYLRRERADHTLQTTALVHEAYLGLMKQETISLENRAHFFAVCANLMRQILIQYARHRNAEKRGAGHKLILDDVVNLISLPVGRGIPDLPAEGFSDIAHLVASEKARMIAAHGVAAGRAPDTYAYVKETVQRDLYRIPLH
jgi:hypothetical protein